MTEDKKKEPETKRGPKAVGGLKESEERNH